MTLHLGGCVVRAISTPVSDGDHRETLLPTRQNISTRSPGSVSSNRWRVNEGKSSIRLTLRLSVTEKVLVVNSSLCLPFFWRSLNVDLCFFGPVFLFLFSSLPCPTSILSVLTSVVTPTWYPSGHTRVVHVPVVHLQCRLEL